MTLEITASSYSIKNYLIFGIISLAAAGWFGNDGYNPNSSYYKKQMEKGNGQPTLDLKMNRMAPIPLLIFAGYNLFMMTSIKKRRIVADNINLTIDGKTVIPYNAITKLDKRQFGEKGYFILYYKQTTEEKQIRLSDRTYDKLGLLLDEIIAKTGAVPQSQANNPPAN